MSKNIEAPITFYKTNSETPQRVNLSAETPRINFAEEIQIRLSKQK
jgi:hypothetical protein